MAAFFLLTWFVLLFYAVRLIARGWSAASELGGKQFIDEGTRYVTKVQHREERGLAGFQVFAAFSRALWLNAEDTDPTVPPRHAGLTGARREATQGREDRRAVNWILSHLQGEHVLRVAVLQGDCNSVRVSGLLVGGARHAHRKRLRLSVTPSNAALDAELQAAAARWLGIEIKPSANCT